VLTVARNRRKNRALHLARQQAARNAEGIRLNIDPGEALQEVLDRAVSMLRFAGEKAADVPEDQVIIMGAFGPMENVWVHLEERMRLEVGHLAANMVKIGLAEREVRMKEAQAALIVAALVEAAREAGIPRDQVKRLGPALRAKLTDIEGTATEREPVAA
jgi:hypothetical protein